MPPVNDTYALAWQYQQAQNFAAAEQLYRQVLQSDANHADAWRQLGAVCLSLGKAAEAEGIFRHAVELAPDQPSCRVFLGIALARQNKFAAAAECFEEVRRRWPGNMAACNNLGLVRMHQSQWEDAVALFRESLEHHPDSPDVHSNLCASLRELRCLDESIAHAREALRMQPRHAEAYINLGNSLLDQNKLDEAIDCFQQTLSINPKFAMAYNNLGNAQRKQAKIDDAHRSYQRAYELNPNNAMICFNLGLVLEKKGQIQEAIRFYQQALQINPRFSDACYNLGFVFDQKNQADQAVHYYSKAIHLRPDFAQAHNNLGCVYQRQGRLALALVGFQNALRHQPELAMAQSNLVSCLNYDLQADPDTIFAEHRRWGTMQEQVATPLPHSNEPLPDRRLRIGYVSPDLYLHPLARYFEPVLAHHHPEQVEVLCYAEVSHPDAVTERLRKQVHVWRFTCALSDAEFAQQIQADRIDILVDLAGHTRNSRLRIFAQKPAPVQVTWLGYMNTTGLTAMDYRITDEVLDPPGQPVLDTEELIRLPGGMCCFAPPADAPAVTPLPALERGHLTFGSLSNLFKHNTKVFDLWSEVLKAVPTARLIMYHHTLVGSSIERVRRHFTDAGVASERFELRHGSFGPGYLGVYNEIDVSLDTFPCTGGVTTCESLWMGVPMLSLCGDRPAGRNSAALLARVGLADWALATTEQFVSYAVGLSTRLDQLAQVRAGLRERVATALCDAERFTCTLEDAYRTMWRRWCAQQAPHG